MVATILQVLPGLNQGGVERGTIEIDNALVAAGWKSVVASKGGRLVPQLKGTHLQMDLNTKNPLKILLNVRALKKVIREHKIDIIHARSRAPAWSAYLAAKACGVHFVTTFHGTYGMQNAAKRKYNSVMVKGEKVIAVSNFIRRHILETYEVEPSRIETIHRGADLYLFNPEVAPIGLGLPAGKKVVMMPGRVTRWKGQHIFVEAMRGVNSIGVIVGDIGSAEYMREIEAVMPDNIIVLPGTSDLPPVLANADVVVSASLQPEAFGRVAVEAQAMGKPVVATNIGGACETVVDGVTGFLVAPGDVEAMRRAIDKLLEFGAGFKDACVNNAREFSSEKMCVRTLEVYRSLLSIQPTVTPRT